MIVGPVVKIDPSVLPVAANIHYLGPKSYDELPSYIAGWDVALLPFARNEATRYHQSDQDARVSRRRQAGRLDLDPGRRAALRQFRAWRRIADDPDEFVAAVEAALAEDAGGTTASGRRLSDPDVVGRDVDAHVSARSARR